MCDIWKETSATEISPEQLDFHLRSIENLSVKWVVLSGGEPLMHSDLFRLTDLLKSRGIRVTLLSTGLLLKRNAARLASSVDDIIVSLDGPPVVHNEIRRVPGAFSMLQAGIREVKSRNPDLPIAARCTLQRKNHAHVQETARSAREAGLTSISFLAADLTSDAFNRPEPWEPTRQDQIALSEEHIATLERELDALHRAWSGTGFVLEDRHKLNRIVEHFKAHLGLCTETAPRCNAPWVSAVVEANGTVRPCFFHSSIGSLQTDTLLQIVNGFQAQTFRASLDVSTSPICRRCVCSLYL